MQNYDIVVGKPRPTNNPIINAHKCEVGKPKRHTDYHVHNSDVNKTYGAPLKRDPESAGEVMLTWKEHEPRRHPIDLGRDFVQLNKEAANAGVVTASNVTDFRSTHDARKRPQVLLHKNKSPLKSSGGHVYGKKSGSDGTCVRDLMQNKYEMEWVQDQYMRQGRKEAEDAKRQALRDQSPLRVRATPSPHARYFHSPQPVSDPYAGFQLREFQNIPSKVKEMRSPSPYVDRSHHSNTPTLPPINARSKSPCF